MYQSEIKEFGLRVPKVDQSIENTGAPETVPSVLLYGNRLSQISWLVNIAATQHSYVIG